MEFEGIGALNPGNGNNIRVQATKTVLEGNSIITFGAFLTGHTAEDNGNIGGFVKIASDMWTVALQATTGMRSFKATSLSFEKNIFMNKSFIVDAYGMFSNSVVDPFLDLQTYHAGLTCTHIFGHGITVNGFHVPTTRLSGIGAVAKVNLWTTEETQLYFTAKLSRTFPAESASTTTFGYGISLGLNF
ncbi:attacin-A [Ceratitis capitata]|uniref:attacin-A n=1 Tax=Ceratitis capitata TaxID=7213 RepID=UPI00032A1694|nr:attacin-A [Ceratitis capitata]